MTRKKFTACILCGGKSTRMGRDKAGVEFQGVPLWRHQLGILREAGADEIVISGRRDADYAGCGLPVVEDKVRNSGPLGGVHAVMESSTYPLILVLAIDMPFMSAAFLRGLVDRCEAAKGIVPEDAGGYEGLAAVYPVTTKGIAARLLDGYDHSMQRFVSECLAQKQVVSLKIEAADEIFFQNINTPAELDGISR
jgi:molybdopterin-guanine dinucleotide biosynthesis protein A